MGGIVFTGGKYPMKITVSRSAESHTWQRSTITLELLPAASFFCRIMLFWKVQVSNGCSYRTKGRSAEGPAKAKSPAQIQALAASRYQDIFAMCCPVAAGRAQP